MIDIEKVEALALFAQAERTKWEEAGKPWPQPNMALIDMIMALSPLVVLGLIRHIKTITADRDAEKGMKSVARMQRDIQCDLVIKRGEEIGQLKAENEDLKGRLAAAPALNCFDEIARLKAENERLQAALKAHQISPRICADWDERWFLVCSGFEGPKFKSEQEAAEWAINQGYEIKTGDHSRLQMKGSETWWSVQ